MPTNLRESFVGLVLPLGLILSAPRLAAAADSPGCAVVPAGKQVVLRSPFLVLRLDTANGLRAMSWENRMTGRTISLGGGMELGLDLGGDGGQPQALDLPSCDLISEPGGGQQKVAFKLTAKPPGISALVSYVLDATQPLLHKMVEVINVTDRPVRLLNVRLGTYRTDANIVAGEQGFPAYLDDEFFMTLAHPAGWATAKGPEVSLCQYPGVKIGPGQQFRCMEAIFGVGEAGAARKTFVSHVRSRMRRVVRGHDKPYAIFEPFGARPDGNFDETEAFVLDNIAKVAAGQRDSGCHFDLHSVDFWVDSKGDLKKFDPVRFPNGMAKINEELKKLGTAPGLWIDSSMTHWSIGGNPAVRPTFTHDPKSPAPSVPIMCRATEPIKSMYVEAFRHHIRENGVRLLKFDNLHTTCNNPNHDHLPGIYSTEAIENAVIDFLHEMDRECPDVFLMLYWGHRSPWWLLHADTLFDSGIGIEAASPSNFPAPHARDSITQKLDQAQWYAKDVPPLGKDSLGVWLSSWGWNSSVGKERWPEGFIMDICRGSLLAQPWSDTPWLSPPERKQMAEFIALLKARPECFANPRFILGNPWKDEPYGYCCTDGKRAFLALSNCVWKDSFFTLKLNSAWGLPDRRAWDLYRWYPEPARLQGESGKFGPEVTIALRPFEVDLIEVVPHGGAPSLNRTFEARPIPAGFPEASRRLDVTVDEVRLDAEPATPSIWTVLKPTTCRSTGGATLTVQKDRSVLAGGKNTSPDTYTITASTDLAGITAIRLEVLPDASLPGNGPGRAVNGNFALNEFRVQAAPPGNPAAAAPVALRNPAADFSQTGHGGWPVAAAIDGNPNTGWSIDPQEGTSHTAVFETVGPVGTAGATTLTFTLQHGPREHNIGRLRLSVTTARPPIPLPKGYGSKTFLVKGQAPPSRTGGLLVVTAEMRRDSKPAAVHNVGACFTAQGKLGGQPVPWTPVLGKATYPSSWQGWRVATEASAESQKFELSVTTTLSGNLAWTYRAHFLPR
jgi:hypothetical protein